MKFSYRFSNLFGTVYHRGNVLFSPDGNILISPVGNRISMYDLRKHKSETLPIESQYNFTTLALSPNGLLLVAVDELGKALLCSVPHRTVIHSFNFKRKVSDIKFSPNGKYLGVTKGNDFFVYHAPVCNSKQFNPFVLKNQYCYHLDETSCIDWTSDSGVVAVGSLDMSTRIFAVDEYENFFTCTLGGHSDSIVGCFFEENSLNLYTVSKNGQVCVWESSVDLSGLVHKTKNKKEDTNSDGEDDIVTTKKEKLATNKDEAKVFYKKIGKHFLKDDLDEFKGMVNLTAAAYHRKTHILVTGFSNGSFLLFEMPACNQIHNLTLPNQKIGSISFNCTGDWIAMGSEGIGQLVVWEWQSESFVLKQQGHFNNMNCFAYSPDGMYIASGGEDGKVKLWDTSTGFCFVTFSEHTSAITGVSFSQNSKTVLSASLDGTVRAFDLNRYRNFKTYTTPKPTQFSCLAVDRSGELICAGSEENFEIYVWYIKTGDLLSIFAAHEAPVSSIAFSPSDLFVASVSWDRTLRLWHLGSSKTHREVVSLSADGLFVVYRPDGAEVAVATLDGNISFFDVYTQEQTGSINGRNDLYVGRRGSDLVSTKTLIKSQAFRTLCYTADGECILAAGRSKFVCIYNVKEKLLMKKFEITCNLSFDAVNDFINRRKMTAFGNKALIEDRADMESVIIPVPGSKKIDRSSRTFTPEINVTSLQFSPTGRSWAATTTEGLLVYSLDNNLIFDPFDLDIENTPDTIRATLKSGKYSQAVMMALRLNETQLIQEVVESISLENIETIVAYFPQLYVEKLLRFVVDQLDTSAHLDFYVRWITSLLTLHGMKVKLNSKGNMATLRAMQKSLSRRLEEMNKICGTFKYLMEHCLALGNIKKRKAESSIDASDILMSEEKTVDGIAEEEMSE